MLFTSKKNDNLRLCVNYRGLNRIIVKNRHSLSFISQVLNMLFDNKFFTKFDFGDAYHMIRIRKNDEGKTTFRIRYKHFEYLMMSFELINASITFQAYVNKALIDLIDIICVIYLNDILVFSKNRETHVQNVRKMLRRLRKFKLYAKLKKCFFFVIVVEYLRFIVTNENITMKPRRVNIVFDGFVSRFFKNIQIFLNFVNFYRRFVFEYFRIILSLIDMLKNIKTEIKKNRFIEMTKSQQHLTSCATFSKSFRY